MKVVFKYPVPANGVVSVPVARQILSVACQNEKPFIWCLVDSDHEEQEEQFALVPTGREFDNKGWKYIGTFHGVDGWLVSHLFEKERLVIDATGN